MKNKVWFITGASKGLGLSLVKKLLQKGYRVAATSRNVKELQREVDGTPDQFLALNVDLTNESSVKAAIDETVQHFGNIDVIVNNAGYGIVGSLEELSDEEARENFNINVFGSLNVIRKFFRIISCGSKTFWREGDDCITRLLPNKIPGSRIAWCSSKRNSGI